MLLFAAYKYIAIPYLIEGSPAPATVTNPSTKFVGTSGIGSLFHLKYIFHYNLS